MICDLTYYVENTETWIFRLIKLDKNINDRCAQVCFVNKTDECETHMLICYLCRSERHRRNSIDFGFYIFVETQRPDFRNSAFRTATQQAVKTICNIYLLLLWTYEWSIWNTEPHCIWLVTTADELCTLSAMFVYVQRLSCFEHFRNWLKLKFYVFTYWIPFWTRFVYNK